MKSVTSYQMQLIDRITQGRFNIPSIILMENAGRAASSLAMDMLKEKKRVAIFCGKGNNGGDGLVVARYLIKNKLNVTTYILCSEDELKKDPAINLKLLKKLHAKIVKLRAKDDLSSIEGLSDCALIIDAIFGIGFKGRPNAFISKLIDIINKSRVKILSIDVPSGLDATNGECKGPCIKATKTITFGLPKSGFYKLNGPKFTGRIIVKNIGFPPSLLCNPPSI